MCLEHLTVVGKNCSTVTVPKQIVFCQTFSKILVAHGRNTPYKRLIGLSFGGTVYHLMILSG